MKIQVHIKHYLTASGIDFFKNWILRVKEYISAKPGYLDLSYEVFHENDQDGMVYVCLEFASLAQLESWQDEPLHEALLDEIDCYRSRNYWEVCITENKHLDWRNADYEVIYT